MRIPKLANRRHGIAAVEAAVIAIPLMMFLVGIWEVGRMVQVKQLCVNATREGARLAALGFNVNTTGAFSYVYTSTATPAPSDRVVRYVEDAVKDSLIGAGITNVTGVTTEFEFLTGDLGRTEPYEGVKGDMFKLRTAVPYNNFAWSKGVILNASDVVTEVKWMMLTDSPFELNSDTPGWDGVVDPAS